VVVPAEAVQPGQNGPFVYVVKPDNHAEARPVQPGRTFGERVIIDKGIASGERVVVDGQLRLAPGAEVRVVEAVKADTGKL
jgi:multidrug efflux system membrane fusion protein